MAWGGNDGAVDRWVKQLEENDPKLGSLHILSFRRVSTADLGRIFQAIGTNTNLRDLYVSGHALDATSIDHLSEALTLNETLKTLNLGNSTFGKDAHVFGLFCEGLAANEGLVKLDFENKGLLTNNNYQVCELLAACIAKNKTLEEINLARNDLDDKALALLAPALKNLKKINLSMNNIGTEGANAIAQHLIKDGQVEELDLSDNALLGGAAVVASALETNETLRSLKMVDVVSPLEEELSQLPPAAMDVEEKKIEEANEARKTDNTRSKHGNALVSALGKALESNRTLTQLCLDNNGIESKVIVDLTKHLALSSIVELKLRQNRIDDEGALLISQVNTLRHLELGENSIGFKGFGALLDMPLQYLGLFSNLVGGFGQDPTLIPELKNSTIQRLDIGCNHVVHQDLEAMVEILLKQGVPSLQLLEMGGNVLDNEMEQWDSTVSRLLAERDLEIVWKRKPSQMDSSMPPPAAI